MNKILLLPISGIFIGVILLILRLKADDVHSVDSVVFIMPSALLTVSTICFIRIRRRLRIWNI